MAVKAEGVKLPGTLSAHCSTWYQSQLNKTDINDHFFIEGGIVIISKGFMLLSDPVSTT
jgi:hypothetical protein